LARLWQGMVMPLWHTKLFTMIFLLLLAGLLCFWLFFLATDYFEKI